MNDYNVASTTARDGTSIGWEVVGSGPPLLVLHGGGRAGKHYRTLAKHLPSSFTVILVDRRGLGLTPSAPIADLQTIVGDIGAVLDATGAGRVLGHSAGALFSLEVASRLPIRELAVYEPPLPAETGPLLSFFSKV